MSPTSKDDGENTPKGLSNEATQQEGTPLLVKKGAEDDALDETSFQLNPEVLQIAHLQGLDELEVVVIRPASIGERWTEGLMIHLMGAGIYTVIGFTLGLMFR
jgi:hypothetical protein